MTTFLVVHELEAVVTTTVEATDQVRAGVGTTAFPHVTFIDICKSCTLYVKSFNKTRTLEHGNNIKHVHCTPTAMVATSCTLVDMSLNILNIERLHRSYENNTTKIDQQTVNMGVVVYYGSAMNVVDRHYDYRSKE